MSKKLIEEDIKLINDCFKKMERNDEFLPITYQKIEFNKELLEECVYCVNDVYHKEGVYDNYEPNKFGLELYHLIEKINHKIYSLEEKSKDTTERC